MWYGMVWYGMVGVCEGQGASHAMGERWVHVHWEVVVVGVGDRPFLQRRVVVVPEPPRHLQELLDGHRFNGAVT